MSLIRSICVLGVLAAVVAAQCETCGGKGWVPCTGDDHDDHESCGVEFEHDCTTVFRARCCRGLLRIECPSCRGAAEELRKQRDARKAWVHDVTRLDLTIGKPFTHVRTKHFVVHSTIEEWRLPGKGKISRNRYAHIVAKRLEETAKTFERLVGALPAKRQDAYVVWDREECIRANRHLIDTPFDGPRHSFRKSNAMWIGFPYHASLYTDRGMHSYVVHNGVHLLLNGIYRLQTTACWFQMGLAAYVTHHTFDGDKVNTHFCSPFQDAHPLRASRGWKKFVRKEVNRGKGVTLAKLDGIKDILDADYRQHAYAWTYVSFLVTQGTEKLHQLIVQMKKGFTGVDAVERVYGWKPEDLQKRWHKFVLRRLK